MLSGLNHDLLVHFIYPFGVPWLHYGSRSVYRLHFKMILNNCNLKWVSEWLHNAKCVSFSYIMLRSSMKWCPLRTTPTRLVLSFYWYYSETKDREWACKRVRNACSEPTHFTNKNKLKADITILYALVWPGRRSNHTPGEHTNNYIINVVL